MAIIQAGSANVASQIVPAFNVIIQPPGVALNGAPTNTLGMVGGASWGPVNTPVVFGGTADGSQAFGPVTNRPFDMLTHVSVAALQGCQSFIGVRVTDGTDTAAAFGLATASGQAIGWGSRYTGVVGNATTATLSAGSQAGTWRCTLSNSILGVTEVFDNLSGAAGTNAVWVAMAAAINNGQGPGRPPSVLVVAGAGASTSAPTATTYSLGGGADGVSGLTAAMLIGQDGLSRTGMYALRKQPISVLDLVDMTDWTQCSVVNALAASEGWYAPIGGPAGQSISTAVAAAPQPGYGVKLLFGDALYWSDQVNNLTRLVNPSAFAAGLLATLDPNQSSLNKPLTGIVGSQRAGQASSGQTATFAFAEKQALFQAGIDLIGNPSPGGAYWSVLGGYNASGNAATRLDAYTRMTNFLATTLQGGMGAYIGQPITTTLFGNARASLLGLLSNMVQDGYLDPTYGTPYSVVCDASNNPQTQTSLGYLRADVQVRYEGTVQNFNVTLAGGQTVVVTTTSGS
ncbi:phage tail protein [Acetobacteraceae bacterium KSS8]|uniref:Phage tail protein n=1 Tax=Endosaccharibacter trunci TaxID=2812733 RepID=A0ABT1WAF4_9PROT|nr:phage tail protein [Acetobacteraceae bacterium KSS8]